MIPTVRAAGKRAGGVVLHHFEAIASGEHVDQPASRLHEMALTISAFDRLRLLGVGLAAKQTRDFLVGDRIEVHRAG